MTNGIPAVTDPTDSQSPAAAVVRDILDRLEGTLTESLAAGKPIELEPYRGRLFEVFVMADATGFLMEGEAFDLTVDGVARELALRWHLGRSLATPDPQAKALSPDQLQRLKLLWSFMRMWMEWTYAWQRWAEFHAPRSR